MKNRPEDLWAQPQTLNGIYRGIVEERNDPLQMGRCKIRIFGIHTDKKNKNNVEGIPTEELPWAEPATSIIEGSVSGFGLFAVPLHGSHVFVFFEAGNIMQPRYFASAPGIPSEPSNNTKGFNDPEGIYPREDRLNESDFHRLARGEHENTSIQYRKENIDKGVKFAYDKKWDEPEPYYLKTEEKYPNNIVLATHGGISLEIDCNPENPRLHIFHPSNTYVEIDGDGNMIIRNEGDRHDITRKNKRSHTLQNEHETIDKEKTKRVGGNEKDEIIKDKKEWIGNDYIKEVVGNTFETLKGFKIKHTIGNNSELIKGNREEKVNGNKDTSVSGEIKISSKGVIDIKSNSTINIQGSSNVNIQGGPGIHQDAGVIHLNSGTSSSASEATWTNPEIKLPKDKE